MATREPIQPPGFFPEPSTAVEPPPPAPAGPALVPRALAPPPLVWSPPDLCPPASPAPPRKGRRCLVNVVCGEDRDHQLTRDNHRRYAERCGAEYVVIHAERPPPDVYATVWKYRATEVAARYDQTLYLDSDCVVTRWAPDLFSRVPLGAWGLVDELPWIAPAGIAAAREAFDRAADGIGRPRRPMVRSGNGGVLVMPTDAARVFRPDVVDHWVADQANLSFRLACGEADHRWLDWRWNCCWMFPPALWSGPRPYIRHRAGQSIFESLDKKLAGLVEDLAREGL